MENRGWWARLCDWCGRAWGNVLDLALVFWIARVPLSLCLAGLLILGFTPQAQDLLVEIADSERRGQILFFFFLLFFVWAMPTHYAARLLLDTDARFQAYKARRQSAFLDGAELVVPRLLGIVPFFAMLIAVGRSYTNLPDMDDQWVIDAVKSALRWFALYLVVAMLAFTYYTVRRRDWARTAPFVWVRRRIAFLQPLLSRIVPHGDEGDEGKAQARDFAVVLLMLVFVAFVVLLLVGANRTAEVLPRAMAVPFILGGWLPFLSYLSYLGRRWRAPLILGLFVFIAALSAVFGDKHSVRRIVASETAGRPVDLAPIKLGTAVETWMKANGCEANPATCPRPIIVAGAGGASRAGFFTASVIGYFLQEAKDHGLDENAVRKRLFAISAVSGSAVGAAKTAAAMAAAKEGGQPCVRLQDPLWFGGKVNNWRDCLELLMSGDFLTPVFIGLAFHDASRFPLARDRATMLEEAWERHFAAIVSPPGNAPEPPCWGLSCPFMALRPTAEHWFPLLVLNGASVGTGRRIVTTPLDLTYDPAPATPCPTAEQTESGKDKCRLFSKTQRFHELLADTTPPEGFLAKLQRAILWDQVRGRIPDDVRLSTAAHNSARFPIISPDGAIRNREHQVIDRIVDGGYFENYGALAAQELAEAIRAVQPALAPFVLVVSNDPDVSIDVADETPYDIEDAALFTTFWGPVMAMANVRNARGILAVAHMRAALFAINPRSCAANTAHVRVVRQTQEDSERTRAVSMSWWMSRPIQNHLHQQTQDTKNPNPNLEQLAKVWTALRMTSECRAEQ